MVRQASTVHNAEGVLAIGSTALVITSDSVHLWHRRHSLSPLPVPKPTLASVTCTPAHLFACTSFPSPLPVLPHATHTSSLSPQPRRTPSPHSTQQPTKNSKPSPPSPHPSPCSVTLPPSYRRSPLFPALPRPAPLFSALPRPSQTTQRPSSTPQTSTHLEVHDRAGHAPPVAHERKVARAGRWLRGAGTQRAPHLGFFVFICGERGGEGRGWEGEG